MAFESTGLVLKSLNFFFFFEIWLDKTSIVKLPQWVSLWFSRRSRLEDFSRTVI